MQILHGQSYFQTRSFATLREMIEQSAALYASRPAFRFRNQVDEPLSMRTYAEFWREINHLGTALLALGLAGKRIAVIGENSYAWCLAHAAVVCGVGVVVPLDRLLPEGEIIASLARGEVDAVFYDPSFQTCMEKAHDQVASLSGLIALRTGRPSSRPPVFSQPQAGLLGQTAEQIPAEKTRHWLQLDELLPWGAALEQEGKPTLSQTTIDPDALMALLFTSGTTSVAKAVMLSQRNVCADIQAVASVVKLWPGIRMLSVLPLHHTFENTCGLYIGLYYGAEIHESDGLRHIQKNLQDYHIDMIVGVPILFENFYNKVQATLQKTGKDKLVRRLLPITQGLRKVGIDLRRVLYKQILAAFGGNLQLGICGAAPIDPEIIRFFDAIGIHILQGYGLTETSPVAAGCNSKVFVPGTVGHPMGGIELAVDSEAPGEPGEILVRGPIVMLGYYQDAAATAEVIDSEGWFHTGDIGRIDPATGCLSITGRQKSMIVLKSGKKVFPEEIEYLLGQDKLIKESLVWGEDDEGDVVVSAKVVLDPDVLKEKLGQDASENQIRAHLDQLIREINSRLPSFKGIRQYVFSFQDMVKTTTLKIKRPIEIAGIREWLAHHKLRLKDITGKNIDHEHDEDENTKHG